MAAFVTAFRSEVATSVAAMGFFEQCRTSRKIAKAGFYIGLAGVVGFYTFKLFAPMVAAVAVTGTFFAGLVEIRDPHAIVAVAVRSVAGVPAIPEGLFEPGPGVVAAVDPLGTLSGVRGGDAD